MRLSHTFSRRRHPSISSTTEKFVKKEEEHKVDPNDYFDDAKEGVEMEAVETGAVDPEQVKITNEMTAEEKADEEAQAKWLKPSDEAVWKKVVLLFVVFYCLWVFLLTLSVMGTSFKLLGGKDSAKMFDVVDNPISGLMIGILATVLVQSSSTTTSIIISLVGADELSVNNAVFMVMGANIGTSVTNTIVAMGHFNNPDDLRRGFAAATVHDIFNLLTVAVFLPLNWIYPFLEKMTYEMAKSQTACEGDCVKSEFLKPYISPYSKGVAGYDKKVAGYISKGYCGGECGISYSSTQMKAIQNVVCASNGTDCSKIHADFDQAAWMAPGYLYKKRAPGYITTDANGVGSAGFSFTKPAAANATVKFFDVNNTAVATLAPNTVYEVCGSNVKTGLCDKRLLKGGIAGERWDMTDEGAGTFLVILSLASLCSCLFCIVYFLQIIVKGPAARVLRTVVGFNGYVNIVIGMGITILVQSSSITTATLTPLAAVGLITLEDMLPLTLGANIGTTLTGIMGATVVTSNPVAAWQVALCHLFFNIFGILIWYPIPRLRQVPLDGARWLGKMTAHPKYGKAFPLIYTFTVFFIIPGICYGIAVAATA
jgi:sodium-dependent phosphate cotransporter